MHIQCLRSRNPHVIAGKAYEVEEISWVSWRIRDERGRLLSIRKRDRVNYGPRHTGTEGWRICRASSNPDVESGPAIQTRLRIPQIGQLLAVQCVLFPGPPYEAVYKGTFNAGKAGPGIVVQDSEGYNIHVWPGTATWEVLS